MVRVFVLRDMSAIKIQVTVHLATPHAILVLAQGLINV